MCPATRRRCNSGADCPNRSKESDNIGLFFKIKLFKCNDDFDKNLISKSNAVKAVRVGDLGLINGEWPILGSIENWDRREWPMPNFLRREELANRDWVVTYDDADPTSVIREERVPYGSVELGANGLYGYGAAEKLMTRMLSEGD